LKKKKEKKKRWCQHLKNYSMNPMNIKVAPLFTGHGAHGTNPANMEDERFLSQLFLWVAILFIFWLLVA